MPPLNIIPKPRKGKATVTVKLSVAKIQIQFNRPFSHFHPSQSPRKSRACAKKTPVRLLVILMSATTVTAYTIFIATYSTLNQTTLITSHISVGYSLQLLISRITNVHNLVLL